MGGAAPVIVTVVAVVASVYAGPAVGAAIMESMGYSAAALGVSEATLGAAAISGTTSAVNAAIQGKDPGKILEAGAIGTVSGALGSEVSQAVGGGVLPGETGDIPSGGVGEMTGSTAAGKIAGSAAGSGASSFTRSELSGSNLQQALRQGEIGAATGAITSAIGEGYKGAGGLSDDARLLSSISSPFVAQNVSGLFAPQTPSTQVGAGGPTTQYVGSAPTTGQPAPGSAALGQALRIGDPGAPIESPGGGESSRQPVWNLASLRIKDETGSA